MQQLGVLRYARGPYQPAGQAPTYEVGLPQGVVSISLSFLYVGSFYTEKMSPFFFFIKADI